VAANSDALTEQTERESLDARTEKEEPETITKSESRVTPAVGCSHSNDGDVTYSNWTPSAV
jgi:hypothetical protein